MGRGRSRARAGFTLVELMIALVIICVGILALAGTMQSSMRLQRIGRSHDELTTLADAKLEAMRAAATLRTTDTVQLAVGGSLTSSVAAHADTVVAPNGRTYLRRWSVVNGASGMRQVTVRVSSDRPSSFELRWLDFTSILLVL